MNSENIYDALTDIREDFIVEAQSHIIKKSKRKIVRWCAIAASFMLVVGIGSYIWMNNGTIPFPGEYTGGSSGSNSSGGGMGNHADGSTIFMSYAGPVFPLAALDNAEGITVSRDITYDFSGFGENRTDENSRSLIHSDIIIRDDYTLANDTDIDIAVNTVYPFAGSFSDLHRLRPAISVDGNTISADLIAGVYSGGFMGVHGSNDDTLSNLKPISSWEGYTALLSDGEYLKHAMGNVIELNQIVTVYEFADVRADHNNAVAPTLAASFNLDYERTSVLTYYFNGAAWDRENGFMRRSFFVQQEGFHRYHSSYFMIIIGDDVENLALQGYKNGGCNPGEELDDVTADVRRYEAVLGDILMLLFDDYMAWHNEINADDMNHPGESLDMALLYRAAAELLSSYGALSETTAHRYDIGELTDIFSETLVMERVFYLIAEIDIPAGEHINVNIDLVKQGSFDFHGSGSGNVGLYGYDMVTTLGSNLIFNAMTASIDGAEYIEIVRQNFGFDPGGGTSSVVLDLSIPRYYIEVFGVPQEQQ